MKRIFIVALAGITTLSLAGCGINNHKSSSIKSSNVQKHRKYYFNGTTANLHDEKIKITKVSFYSGNDGTDGKNLIVFDYDITNKTNKDIDSISGWNAAFKAYQDNKNTEGRLDVGGLPDDTSQQVLHDQDQTIKKGGTVHSRVSYELDSNKKPVVLKAFKGSDNRFLGQKKFNIGKFKDGTDSSNNSASNVSNTVKDAQAPSQSRNSSKNSSRNDRAAYEKSLRSLDPDYWDSLSPAEKNVYLNDPNYENYYNSPGFVANQMNKENIPLPSQSSGE